MNKSIIHGLKANWQQFLILVLINAFVGGMVGLERTIFPEFAESEFGVKSSTAFLSFILAFGITKAIANYFTGRLSNKLGRKKLLIIGWLFAIPVPLILIFANQWYLVVVANIFLGINQGLAWSSTVIMKIDLVGQKERGLAMGFNEAAGYLAVGVVAFLTGYIANHYAVTPYPFYLGIGIAVMGLLMSLFLAKDTSKFADQEKPEPTHTHQGNIFVETSFKNRTLSSVTQAGLVNNLNDGMVWGLLPALLFSMDYNSEQTGLITALYPAIWGIGQLFTGKMADVFSHKKMLFYGMGLQGLVIVLFGFIQEYYLFVTLSILLGIGTALVYPTFLTAIANNTKPVQRAESIGVFRLWRDMGYAIGALLSGVIADYMGMNYSILAIGVLTILSSLIIKFRMP
ncbi:MFS transporter [Mangrovivirga cuniculi]|uniref:MFS transporter n=1 Tax=Mangrovivirga cuniculi TaxID=2715131 RepID=A0A4D7KBE1_9BACT|nr:MFS transporter [Mangrovivirga cuniculi]QCK16728.1 MFS transporter [Mangrovivirga cuniculi]